MKQIVVGALHVKTMQIKDLGLNLGLNLYMHVPVLRDQLSVLLPKGPCQQEHMFRNQSVKSRRALQISQIKQDPAFVVLRRREVHLANESNLRPGVNRPQITQMM